MTTLLTKWIRLVALLLVLGSIYITWRWFDAGEWWADLRTLAAQPRWLALMLAVYGLSFALKASAWRLYAPSQAPFRVYVHAILYSLLVNHLLPIKAGDAVRAGVLMKQAGQRWDEALHSVGIMRLLDMAVLGLIGGTGIILLGLPTSWWGFAALAGLLALVAVARFLPWLSRLPFVRKHSDYFRTRMMSARGVAIFALVALSWLLEAGVIYGVARILAIPLGGAPLIWANSMTIAGQIFHVTPGGIGTYESTMSGSLYLLGIEGPLAYRAALLSHTFKFAFAYAAGAYALLRLPIRIRDVSQYISRKDFKG
ncbi:lysylphosphatidylglycerol synthase transmembrane domain-containing protein [Paenibacillus sp. HJGM_3]|uniref:lysylphosphatidylglycerol synthase transmembrane domain-containing protein n=1 Tax=Paenibacillus sp. HJGM_3 TaxID=3379816 RepID=UPI00385C70E4